MKTITENPYAIIGNEDDPLGRLDVVELLMAADDGSFIARYDRGKTFTLSAARVISRDAKPDRLLMVRCKLMEFWDGADAAVDEAVGRVQTAFNGLPLDGYIDKGKTIAKAKEMWIDQRQQVWKHVIGQMRQQPVLAPVEPA